MLKSLDAILNTGIRIAIGAYTTTPIQSLLVDIVQLPLNLRSQMQGMIYGLKILSFEKHPLSEEMKQNEETNNIRALINNRNDMHWTISDRLQAAQKCFYAHKNLFKSRLLNRTIKLRIYKTIIQPVLTYSCESWTMTKNDERSLKIFERNILRKIFGPKIDENHEYRRRTNAELEELINGQNVIKAIKSQRLRWAGHVVRMTDDRMPKRIFDATPYNTRARGRPRSRWLDEIEEDCRKIGVQRWRVIAQDRSEWRKIVNEVKAHPEL
ncbi:uncharacterized protein LOC129606494 [Condylostylus longicornis]|uniref:uncharacterized protein LOC129606494 n=1 Tax=Condylostylus longicornis TaxID=2530218 RepID=UPI00244DADDC|nr:uncharacterized protein LOC129606494 [Condylostylus longicornis]